jgi:CubicO group peptidase (beta-lactamase class C family)
MRTKILAIWVILSLILPGCQPTQTATPFSATGAPAPTPTTAGATPAIETFAFDFPQSIDPTRQYLFYLHGQIIEDQGVHAVSPQFGEYAYEAILNNLQAYGFTVISEARPKDTNVEAYAQKIAAQVTTLLDANVPPGQITVVGASKGSYMAAVASHLLQNPDLNFVLLASCAPEMVAGWKQAQMILFGNILSIYDSVDDLAGSCQEIFALSEGRGIARYEELVLQIGSGHGILYQPLEAWVLPTVEWAGAGLPAAAPSVTSRALLTYRDLTEGFEADSPVDESALSLPEQATPPTHVFEGRLELIGEPGNWQIEVMRGELGPEFGSLPAFDFEFIQSGGYLIPVARGLIIADHPVWNLILEPGRAWQEAGDDGLTRVSLPFALVSKGGNSSFNGTLTFLFDDQRVSKVWYQVTQETSSFSRANLWGLLEAAYHPGAVSRADQIRAAFAAELAARLPTKPIQALAEDYPGIDLAAFGRGVTPEHMSWYGVVANGVNYLGGCQTRFGIYPYCESMRAASFSTAKSAFVSVALMRLAQKYDPALAGFLLKDYVPEYAASPGDWEQVAFNHAIDMTTGNYFSARFMADDTGQKMGEFFGAQPYAERIKAAFDSPHASAPGTVWVYRTSDTFILTRALHNYLQTREGADADIFQFVVDEVYRPLGLGPGAFTTMRTADENWQGQAEGGYGLWWIPDDLAKIAILLNNDEGKIGGEQILHPGLLVASLQQDPADRGIAIDGQHMYNNAFWANRYNQSQGFECEFWVASMQGISGNVVALFPNGVSYYYFSDNQEFTWDAALRASDQMAPLCP